MKRFGLIACAAAVVLAAGTNAAVVRYNGDTNPVFTNASQFRLQSAGELAFHGVKFANCTMTSNGQELTMGTVTRQGLWFGNAPSVIGSASIPWTLGGTASGNDLAIRAKLGGGDSKEFGFYWYDGSHATNFYMTDDNSLEILTASGSQTLNFPAGYFDSYRDIRAILKNGTVGYYVDGTALYVGAAFASTTDKLLVIGDGSGSTPTGVGSWVIDEVVFDTAPATVFIPEPGAAGIVLAGAVGLMARRKR